ncbi:MAG TPA: hypothetical protein VFE47_14500 [Tepidisphaeraceae bacterium]|nr:hypothetical protein [Tepidisphaeraceae bacterium]
MLPGFASACGVNDQPHFFRVEGARLPLVRVRVCDGLQVFERGRCCPARAHHPPAKCSNLADIILVGSASDFALQSEFAKVCPNARLHIALAKIAPEDQPQGVENPPGASRNQRGIFFPVGSPCHQMFLERIQMRRQRLATRQLPHVHNLGLHQAGAQVIGLRLNPSVCFLIDGFARDFGIDQHSDVLCHGSAGFLAGIGGPTLARAVVIAEFDVVGFRFAAGAGVAIRVGGFEYAVLHGFTFAFIGSRSATDSPMASARAFNDCSDKNPPPDMNRDIDPLSMPVAAQSLYRERPHASTAPRI